MFNAQLYFVNKTIIILSKNNLESAGFHKDNAKDL